MKNPTLAIALHRKDRSLRITAPEIETLYQRTLRIVQGHPLKTKHAKQVLETLRGARSIAVDVTITNDREVRKLNKQYRKLDKTTDVLSFSLADAGLVAAQSMHLGDIVISSEMVFWQSKKFKVSIEEELRRLLVHGFLHLLGFDHVTVSPLIRDEMRKFEDAILKSDLVVGEQGLLGWIEQAFAQIIPKNDPKSIEHYIGGGRKGSSTYIGLSSPQIRAVFHKIKKQSFSVDALTKLFGQTKIFEVRVLLLLLIEQQRSSISAEKLFSAIRSLVPHIDNWALSDGLSALYSYCLEHAPKKVLPTLQHWNMHSKEWHIRQSLVSLFYYSKMRKRYMPFKTCAALIRPHLRSSYPYVQKAVGWTLRELGNVYPKATEEFLEKHIEDIRGYAFSAATEKMSASRKAFFKKLRAKKRISKG